MYYQFVFIDPITDFLLTKEADLQKKRQQELEYLNNWRNNGKRPEDLAPLLQSYTPVIEQKIRQWKAPAVNEAAFRAELQKHLINAFETYDPSRGAQLSTHVENRLQKAKRFNTKFQNMAYIPEGQAVHIGKIQKAHDELLDELGRPPTHEEIADHIGMSPKQVARIIKSQRKDIPASAFENDPYEYELQRDEEVLSLLPYNLTSDELAVFNHIYGRDGYPQITSTNELAKRLGKSPSQISRIRTSIFNKYQQYK